MPNPLHKITNVFKDHFTTEDKDIYIDTIRLLDYVANEVDRYDFETDGEGEKILNDLNESLDEYAKAQRQDDDAEPEVSEDTDDELERENDDDDDDATLTEASKGT